MKYKTKLKPNAISGIEKIDLSEVHPYSETGCDFVVVYDSLTDEPIVNLKVKSEYHSPFNRCQVINDLVLIGYGDKFIMYDLSCKRKVAELSLGDYFGSFEIDGDDIFVASGCRLYKLKMSGKIEWKTKTLGIDGVVITENTESVISGEGEWDPPGGWKPFKINRNTGRRKRKYL